MRDDQSVDKVLVVRKMLHLIAIFGGLTPEEIEIVIPLLMEMDCVPDQMIFRQGAVSTAIYIVKTGMVKIVMEDPEEGPLELLALYPGACFGETSLIGIQPHSASAVAVEESELLVLSNEKLFSLHKGHMDLFAKIILNIARESCRQLYRSAGVLDHFLHVSHKNHLRD